MYLQFIRVANLAAYWATQPARWAAARAAEYSIGLPGLHRMDAHWALTFSALGTVHLPPDRLRRLGAVLDPASYARVLRRARRGVGPETVALVEEDAPPPTARYIRVSYDYYGIEPDGDALHYPYVPHPWVYATGRYKEVAALRRTPRRFRLFFSGAVNDNYKHDFVFPMMSRPAVTECLLDTFRSDACVVSARAELAALARTDRPIAVVLHRGEVNMRATHHLLPPEQYLRLLAESHFALCPPGVHMPHSHNLFEAMAVGTVPVTNYADYCRPRLADRVTCLAFSTPAELCAAVRYALAAAPGQVEPLAARVSGYYDDEVSHQGFARKLAGLVSGPGPEYRLVLNREWNSARMWEQAVGRLPATNGR